MAKRAAPALLSSAHPKRPHLEPLFRFRSVASPEAAAAADADPPLGKLLQELKDVPKESAGAGDVVVYWMRMEDLRSESTSLFILYPSLICR
jgi:hypothetical protein